MSKRVGETALGNKSKVPGSYWRQFIGFTSTQPPEPSTRDQYESFGVNFFVQHRDFRREMQIVLDLLEKEAQIDRKWASRRARKAVLNQFEATCTHIIL